MPEINVTNATLRGTFTGTITYDEQPPVGGAASIKFVRSVASHDPVFACHDGETTTCNHLVVLGESDGSVEVSVDGGPPLVTNAGSGREWYTVLDILPDGEHTIKAGDATFRFSIAPSFTDLPVKVGENLVSTSVSGYFFNIDGNQYEIQNDASNSIATIVADLHTLHFTIRPQDNWSNYNRDEIASRVQFANGQTFHLTYEFMLHPAYGPFNNAAGSTMVNQIHENNDAGNSTPVLFGMTFYPNRKDAPTWQHDKGNDSYAWLDGAPLARGVWHTYEVVASPVSGQGGKLQIRLNNSLIWNENNLQGTGSKASPYYPKFGLYRGGVNQNNSETQGIMFRNIQTRIV